MDLSDGGYSLGIDTAGLLTSELTVVGLLEVGYSRVPALWDGADYLLIAKPDATNHLGIRSDCAFCLVLDAGW